MSRRVSSPVFVGRDSELRALLAALDDAVAGSGGLVLVDGEAGIGKSRLIEEFLARATQRGVRAITGSCLPFAEAVPYAPIARILGQRRVDEPHDGAPPVDPDPADRYRFFQWVVDQLIAAAALEPIVVVVEDVHWADESTSDLLLFIAGAVRNERIVVVASRRPGEHSGATGLATALGELVRSGRAERLVLTALDDREVAELIGAILGVDPSRGLLQRVVARADGNPFFAEELVAAGGGDDLPTTVGDVILQRVARVGPDTRQLLRAAAVVGRQVGHALLCQVAAVDSAAMDDALRDAVRHQLLVTSRKHYSFRHALGHEAVYGDLLPGERQALHERAAIALAEHPELALDMDPAVAAAELAHHWHAAGRLPETLTASVRAGQAAEAALAPIEADIHYQRAIEVWAHVPDAETHAGVELPLLLEHAAEAASLAGNHHRAAELADRLLDELDPDAEPQRHARALDRRALYLWYEGDVATSKLAGKGLRDGSISAPTPATVTRLCGAAHQLALQLQYVEAREVAHEALAAARSVGGRVEVSFALHVLGSLEGHLGCHEDAIERLRASLTMSVERGDSQRAGATWHNLVEAHVFADRAADALALTDRAVPELRRLGLARTYVALTIGQLTYALVALGRWDAADHTSSTALAEDVEPYFTLPIQFGRLHLLVRRGQFDAATVLLDDLATSFGSNAYTTGVCAGWRAEMAVWQREWDVAKSALDEGLQVTSTTDELLLELRLAALGARLLADEVSWARLNARPADTEAARTAADGHVHRAEAFVTRIEDAVGGCSLPFRRLLDIVRAERSRLDDPPRVKPWSDIAASAGDDVYLAAYAHWREAEALLAGSRRRDRTRAETALRKADAAARSLGATPLLAEVGDVARRARIELTSTQPEDGDAVDLAALGLTSREVDVLRLLANGLSNREIGEALFISAKTASVHVTHIFQKLNVTTRVQAAVFAQRLAG